MASQKGTRVFSRIIFVPTPDDQRTLLVAQNARSIKTLREKPHGLLRPIEIKPILFHPLSIDHIRTLPQSYGSSDGDELFDAIMILIDKFTKGSTFGDRDRKLYCG